MSASASNAAARSGTAHPAYCVSIRWGPPARPSASGPTATYGYEVVIEHPVKTINTSEREGVYQTDTGPVLLPDLRDARIAGEAALVGCLDLAYSAFNARDWAEFIVMAPTPLTSELSVNHYSLPRRIEHVRNTLWMLG